MNGIAERMLIFLGSFILTLFFFLLRIHYSQNHRIESQKNFGLHTLCLEFLDFIKRYWLLSIVLRNLRKKPVPKLNPIKNNIHNLSNKKQTS